MSTGQLAKLGAAVARNVLGAAEFAALRSLRRTFARGGLPPLAQRSPEDDARIAAFAVLSDLLRVMDDFRGRIERGEAVRLVVREQQTAPGCARVEIAIEPREGS